MTTSRFRALMVAGVTVMIIVANSGASSPASEGSLSAGGIDADPQVVQKVAELNHYPEDASEADREAFYAEYSWEILEGAYGCEITPLESEGGSGVVVFEGCVESGGAEAAVETIHAGIAESAAAETGL